MVEWRAGETVSWLAVAMGAWWDGEAESVVGWWDGGMLRWRDGAVVVRWWHGGMV